MRAALRLALFALAASASIALACGAAPPLAEEPQGAPAAPEAPPASAEGLAPIPPTTLRMVPQVMTPGFGLFAVAPDGRHAMSSNSNTVTVWDLRSGLVVRAFSPQEIQPSLCLAFLDAERAVVCGGDATLSLWHLPTGTLLRRFPMGADPVAAVFSDGRRVLVGAGRRLITIDATQGSQGAALDLPEEIHAVAVSPDGTHALVGGDNAAFLVDLGASTVEHVLPHGDRVIDAAWSPDGKRALTASLDRKIRIFDAAGGSEVKSVEVPDDSEAKTETAQSHVAHLALKVHFSPDATRALAWARLQLVSIDLASGTTGPGPSADGATMSGGVAFSRDGEFVLTSPAYGNAFQRSKAGTFVHERTYSAPASSGLLTAFMTRDRLVTASTEAVRVWDLRTGAVARQIPTGGYPTGVFPFPDGRRVAVGVEDKGVVLVDTETGVATWPTRDKITSLAISPDGRRAATRGSLFSGRFEFWDLATGGAVTKAASPFHGKLAFSADGKLAVEESNYDATGMRVFDTATGAVVRTLETGKGKPADSLLALPGNRMLAVQVHEGKIWDLATGQAVVTASLPGINHGCALRPDGAEIAVAKASGVVELRDARTLDLVSTLPAGGGWLYSVSYSPDGKKVAVAGKDGVTRVLTRDAPDATLSLLASGDHWLIHGEDGLFDASRRGGELAAAVVGLDSYRIDQLAARNNRPDLLLARAGYGSPEVLEHYRTRHERRLKKLGLTEGSLGSAFDKAPRVRLIEVKQAGKFADLVVEAEDAGDDLRRLDVYANDVPVFGAAGKPLSGRKQRVDLRVELGAGKTKIEASAVNAGGIESLREVREVSYSGPVEGDLYFLGFGVSRYKDRRLDLAYAHKDASDLAALLRKAPGFKKAHVKTYLDAQVTASAIRGAKDFVREAKVDDTVVVFVAGHGTHTRDAAADYFFVTHDVDVMRLRDTAASFELIEDLVSDIAPRKKLLLLDTCESGERDEAEETAVTAAVAGGRELTARTVRGLVIDGAGPAPATRVRPWIFDRERYIENDLRRRTGTVVLSSSRGSEVSFELASLEQGIFTDSLLTALTSGDADKDHDGMVSTDELLGFVGADVPRRTGERQHPVVDRDNIAQRFGLPAMKTTDRPRTRGQ